MKWTGRSQSVNVPAKQYFDDPGAYTTLPVPWDKEKWEAFGDTSDQPPWNNGYECAGPPLKAMADKATGAIADDLKKNVKTNWWTDNDENKTKKLMYAADCYKWCKKNNEILAKLKKDGTAVTGTGLTCCQWAPEARACDYFLGFEAKWAKTPTTSIFMGWGGKTIEADGVNDYKGLEGTRAEAAK